MPSSNPYVPDGGPVSDSNNPGATNLTPDPSGGPDMGGGESLTSKPRQMPAGGAPAPQGVGSPGMDQMADAAGGDPMSPTGEDTSTAVPNDSGSNPTPPSQGSE